MNNRSKSAFLSAFFAALLPLNAPAVANADPLNLERGLPLEVEDAYPTAFRNREYQAFLRYNRGKSDEDTLDVVQRLEAGIWYNTEMTLEAPFHFGEGAPDDYGDTPVELLYNFNQETRILPAASASGTIIAPTSEDGKGIDSEVEFLLTKTVPGTWDLHRMHLNGGYRFNDDRRDGEREGTYHVVAGYQVRATNELVLLADVFREEKLEKDRAVNMAELGARYRLTPYSLLSFGTGVGFGDQSPEFRTTGGIQMQF